jgi:N-acetylmuramoyl-L-alanine amidase
MMKRLSLHRAMLMLLACLWLAAPALAAPVVTTLPAIESGVMLTPVRHFQLQNPERLVIDLPVIARAELRFPDVKNDPLVKAIRYGQFDAKTTRIVYDLHRPVRVVAVEPGVQLMLRVEAAQGKQPAVSPIDKKPLIVIDAGHGGQDPGAIGRQGTLEKIITLNYAGALREALLKTGRYRVMLTREDDRFIMLHERVKIARDAKADLFISLHADSNPRAEARGFSIYTLSETASDEEAAALAERENKSDIIPGLDLSTTDPEVANILIDLTQRETMNKSAKLADAIVAAMPAKVIKLPKTHRYAGFRVLKAPDVPSVLIELGFLSNAEDERQLLMPEHRKRLVEGVVSGIDRFLAGQ